VLEADAFPPLFIATSGMDAAHTRLVNDYHAWQAPWMLLLPHLDSATEAHWKPPPAGRPNPSRSTAACILR